MPGNLCRLLARLPLAAVLAVGLSAGGCSFSYQLGSMFEKNDDATTEQTGSIGDDAMRRAENAQAQALPESRDDDLDYARAAAAEVLARGGKGISIPWENPHTGARGTVTPIAAAYAQAGSTCRGFLASYLREGATESWLQGEACRLPEGRWEVHSLKPLQKSS